MSDAVGTGAGASGSTQDPITQIGGKWGGGVGGVDIEIVPPSIAGQTDVFNPNDTFDHWDQAYPHSLHDMTFPPTTSSGITVESYSREHGAIANAAYPTVSGTLYLTAIALPAGFTVTNVIFRSGATALVLGTSPHFWFGLWNGSRTLLAQSTDDTAAAWAANSYKSKALSTPQVVPSSGLYYIGFMIAQTGGTLPSLYGIAPDANGPMKDTTLLCGTSSTGLGATAPNPAAAITFNAFRPYCGVG
jgi:hypothetical protein